MEKFKPKYYIETRFEKVIKFPKITREYRYTQPVEYCNGKTYWEYDEDSYERQNWGRLYWQSKWFNNCLDICRYGDKIWQSKEAMDKAFEVIFTTKSSGDGVYTPMKDFEIYLMNKGYDMISFDKMCAQSPCFGIYGDRQEGDKIYNPKGVAYSRFYTNKETGKSIFFGFGIESDKLKFNFYFVHSDAMNLHYQVPVNYEDFEAAEKMQLKSFEELNYELNTTKLFG